MLESVMNIDLKKHIRNFDHGELVSIFEKEGIRPNRAKELCTWLYYKNALDFDEIQSFSRNIREKLSQFYNITSLELVSKVLSSDTTNYKKTSSDTNSDYSTVYSSDTATKYLFRTKDGHFIESVLLNDEGRFTICLSSQAGCAMNCSFCFTAKNGFKRSLECGEILDQLALIRNDSGINNTNVVFMGMGEPFENYENVVKASRIMEYTYGMNISKNRITISTCGILPKIKEFYLQQLPYNLAISLNDTDFKKRAEIMPIEKKFPFIEIAEFINKQRPYSKNRISIEYIMHSDNINKENALALKNLFNYNHILINLIKLNGNPDDFKVSEDQKIAQFVLLLEEYKIPFKIRKSLGEDINAACGQLASTLQK